MIILTQKPEELKPLFVSLEAAGVTDYVVGIDDKSDFATKSWLLSFLDKGGVLGLDRTSDITTFPFTFDDDFSKARNMTLERLPADTDWHLWIDSDDTLECRSGRTIPEYLEEAGKDINAVFCDYEYHRDQYGNVDTLQTRHRILSGREKWFWKNRVHEDVHIVGGKPLQAAETNEFVWVHHPDEKTRDPERNFRILKKAIADEPDQPRNYYYLGNQHFAAHHWQEAIEAFATYKPRSGRVDEKWSACIYMGIAYQMLDDYDAAAACYQEAMVVQPKWADSYFGLGEIAARRAQWEQAIQWGEVGIQRVMAGDGVTDKSNFVNANAYNFAPYVWLGQAYYNVGQNDKALAAFEQAAKFRQEPDLLYKIRHLVAAMSRQQAIDKGKSLAAHLVRTNEPIKAREVLRNLPAGAVEQDPMVAGAQMVVAKRLHHLASETEYRNYYFTHRESDITALEEEMANIPWKFPRIHWVLRRLQAAGVKKVLDIGIGNALASFYFARHGIKVVGIDIDWKRVKEANFAAVKLGYLKAFRPPNVNGHRKKQPRMIQMDPGAVAQFHCCPADAISEQVKALGPFDAVVAAEIIEHVEFPERILDQAEKMAPRVLLTTPDASYDGPQEQNTNHVRGWSQRELVPLIAPRGRIVELHKVAHPIPEEQPTIAAEYVTGEKLGGLPVIFWCFDTGQEWTPDSIWNGGIGGSETAVIRVAEELAKKGCRVTVYAECEGVWNGVRYAKSMNFDPQPCWLFVSWRSVGPTVEMKGLAEHRFIWVHDVDFGPATAEQLEGVKVVALSEWHKQYLTERHPTADIFVSGNGIDPARFEVERECDKQRHSAMEPCLEHLGVNRDPHRLIYAHSPDRGLDVVLRVFPKVRERYADAELHVFYGMDLLERTGKRAFKKQIEEAAKQPGVTLHGRISQDDLAVEYLRAAADLYPGVQPNGKPFWETYGISVLEAQAGGCVPITPNWGALPEVNQYGIVLTEPDEDHLLSALLHLWVGDGTPFSTDQDREAMMKWARQQTWAKVVDGWLDMLTLKQLGLETAASA